MRCTSLFSIALAMLASTACSDESPSYSAGLTAEISVRDGQASFVTQDLAASEKPASEIVGQPFVYAVFEPGFSLENDDALYRSWGRVPDDLVVSAESPAMFEPGAYDQILVIYAGSEIGDDIYGQFDVLPPAPDQGDIVAMDFNATVLPGDPEPTLGNLRVNIVDGDEMNIVRNLPEGADISDPDQLRAAFDDGLILFRDVSR